MRDTIKINGKEYTKSYGSIFKYITSDWWPDYEETADMTIEQLWNAMVEKADEEKEEEEAAAVLRIKEVVTESKYWNKTLYLSCGEVLNKTYEHNGKQYLLYLNLDINSNDLYIYEYRNMFEFDEIKNEINNAIEDSFEAIVDNLKDAENDESGYYDNGNEWDVNFTTEFFDNYCTGGWKEIKE